VKAKIREAGLAACDQKLDGAEAIEIFIDRTLPFSISGPK
jgi:hypothetical protein